LRYFDLDYPWFNYQIAEKTFTVADQPFQITEGTYIQLTYPMLLVPEGNIDPGMAFSPQNSFVSLLSISRNEDLTFGKTIQVYDANTLQLVATFESHSNSQSNRVLYNSPLWTPDESNLFLSYNLLRSSFIGKTELTQVSVNEGFQENRNLFNTLEDLLGDGIMFSSPSLKAAISPSGNILTLHLYDPEQNQYYQVAYTLSTGDILAMCDNGYPDPKLSYPVWSPDERYFGYWGGAIRLFDLTTGQRSGLDGEGFVGWVNSTIVPITPTPTPTETLVETVTHTATDTPSSTSFYKFTCLVHQ
jgi:hypothetical protein